LAQQKQLKFISNLKNNNEIEQTTADEEFQKLVAQIEALKNEMSQSEKELKDKHEYIFNYILSNYKIKLPY
jgi:hypothetical protein